MSERLVKDSDYTLVDGVLRIRDGVKEIPDGSFKHIVSFNRGDEIIVVIVPSSVTRIGEEAFAFHDELETVVFPLTSQSQLTEIGAAAFLGCRRLKQITLPNKLKTIGNGAFANTGLLFIEIPGTVEKVSFSAFRQTHLHGIIMNEGVKYIENYAFDIYPGQLQTIVIPSTVLSIASCAISYAWIPENYQDNYYENVFYRDNELLEAAKAKPQKQVITRSQQTAIETHNDADIIEEIKTYDKKGIDIPKEDVPIGFVIIN